MVILILSHTIKMSAAGRTHIMLFQNMAGIQHKNHNDFYNQCRLSSVPVELLRGGI